MRAQGEWARICGAVLNWEARFIGAPKGLRVVFFAGISQRWIQFAPARKIIVRGMKIGK